MGLKKIFGHWDKREATTEDFTGTWRNELNSQMSIEVDENGMVSGNYQTGSSKGVSDIKYPLTGFANDSLISFCVDFGEIQMICSWTGHIVRERGATIIKAQWNLVKNHVGEEFTMETWGATHCGSNSFKRV